MAGNGCVADKPSKPDDMLVEFKLSKQLKRKKGEESISVKLSKLDGVFDQYSYVESVNMTSNILVHTKNKVVHASNNGGVSFVDVPVDDDILFFLVGPVNETAVLVSMKYLYVSSDGGNTFTKLQSPGIPTPPACQLFLST